MPILYHDPLTALLAAVVMLFLILSRWITGMH
jgi:hypothetical protein